MAATLICVGIPTVRPLYRHIVHGSRFKESNEGYKKHDESGESNPVINMKPLGKKPRKGDLDTTTSTVLGDTEFDMPRGETSSYVQHVRETDEERLVGSPGGPYGHSIQVQEEVTVERTSMMSR
jgi:hypothetical protein